MASSLSFRERVNVVVHSSTAVYALLFGFTALYIFMQPSNDRVNVLFFYLFGVEETCTVVYVRPVGTKGLYECTYEFVHPESRDNITAYAYSDIPIVHKVGTKVSILVFAKKGCFSVFPGLRSTVVKPCSVWWYFLMVVLGIVMVLSFRKRLRVIYLIGNGTIVWAERNVHNDYDFQLLGVEKYDFNTGSGIEVEVMIARLGWNMTEALPKSKQLIYAPNKPKKFVAVSDLGTYAETLYNDIAYLEQDEGSTDVLPPAVYKQLEGEDYKIMLRIAKWGFRAVLVITLLLGTALQTELCLLMNSRTVMGKIVLEGFRSAQVNNHYLPYTFTTPDGGVQVGEALIENLYYYPGLNIEINYSPVLPFIHRPSDRVLLGFFGTFALIGFVYILYISTVIEANKKKDRRLNIAIKGVCTPCYIHRLMKSKVGGELKYTYHIIYEINTGKKIKSSFSSTVFLPKSQVLHLVYVPGQSRKFIIIEDLPVKAMRFLANRFGVDNLVVSV